MRSGVVQFDTTIYPRVVSGSGLALSPVYAQKWCLDPQNRRFWVISGAAVCVHLSLCLGRKKIVGRMVGLNYHRDRKGGSSVGVCRVDLLELVLRGGLGR